MGVVRLNTFLIFQQRSFSALVKLFCLGLVAGCLWMPGSTLAAPARKKKAGKVLKNKAKKRRKKNAYRRFLRSIGQIDVIGRRPSALDAVPGSASTIGKGELKALQPLTLGEALRNTAGANVVSEEGMGLRLNIGLRGQDPLRSRRVLMLEDGVPIGMAPYGEPDLYYSPPIERISRMEIVKGSGSILWGPQTIGGVVNLITPEPPKDFRFTADLRTAPWDGYYFGLLTVGDTIKNFGYFASVLHKRFNGPRNLNLAMTDVMGKVRIQLSPGSIFGLKAQFYDEYSHSSYLGLTTPQFYNNDQSNHATYDRFPIRRYALSATHRLLVGMSGMLQTTLYTHNVTRFWQRQDYDRAPVAGRTYERIVNGNNQVVQSAPGDGSSLFFRNSTGNRNREFTIGGLSFRYNLDYDLGPVANELFAGVRFHYEAAAEQYLIGENGKSPSGVIRDHEVRDTMALALYLQNNFLLLNRKLRISPGFRFELIRGFRRLFRTRVKQADGSRKIQDTNLQEDTLMLAPIPGLGLSYELSRGLNLFAGVHRGFAPPRTKDSITADGDDLELDPEFSWNTELGIRWRKKNYFFAEVAVFYTYFESQVIPPSESSGAVANDPNLAGKSSINGGQTQHFGAEVSVRYDLAAMKKWPFRLPLSITYTFVPVAEHVNGRYTGNRIPYSPEHLLSARLSLQLPFGLSATVNGNYVSSQFADKGNTISPSLDGLVGEIPGRFLLDARISYTFRLPGRGRSLSLFVSGKNLLDARYIASRRPQGIQVGLPRTLYTGVSGSF